MGGELASVAPAGFADPGCSVFIHVERCVGDSGMRVRVEMIGEKGLEILEIHLMSHQV